MDSNDQNDQRSDLRSRLKEELAQGGLNVSETLKKVLTTGLSAAFMTEESIRGFVADMKLPKETLQFLLKSAAKSKEELSNRVGREVVNILSKIDFVKEATRFVESHKFKISAEIEVLPKSEPSEASSTAKIRFGSKGSGSKSIKPNDESSDL